MRTELCDRLGIEFPIFAFTHCRDVVAAVSKAGGFGVLGAVGFPPEQLEVELQVDRRARRRQALRRRHRDPRQVRGHGRGRPEEARGDAARRDPASSTASSPTRCSPTTACRSCPRASSRRASCSAGRRRPRRRRSRSRCAHPKVQLIANALGTPPADVIEQHPRRPAAWSPRSAASAKQARVAPGGRRRHHHRAGHRGRRPHRRDRQRRAVARGDRRGRADAGARRRRHRHRPADRRGAGDGRAGRVDRLALAHRAGGRRAAGADASATSTPTSRDTVRSRSFTGKPCRMLRNDWTEAWEAPDSPEAARHAAAVHGHVRRRRARPPLRRQGEGRDVQPGRPDRRPDERACGRCAR